MPRNSAAIARPQPMQLRTRGRTCEQTVRAATFGHVVHSKRCSRTSLLQFSPSVWRLRWTSRLSMSCQRFRTTKKEKSAKTSSTQKKILLPPPTPRPGAPRAESEPFHSVSLCTHNLAHKSAFNTSHVCTRHTYVPPLLYPEPLVVAAPRPKPASGDVLDTRAEDEVSPSSLSPGPVARGQRVVKHARHARPDVRFPHCLRSVA